MTTATTDDFDLDLRIDALDPQQNVAESLQRTSSPVSCSCCTDACAQ
jgi:hypothetical protein